MPHLLREQILGLLRSLGRNESWIKIEHHSHVFVLDRVAVADKAADPRRKPHKDFDLVTRPKDHRILLELIARSR